MSEKKTLFFFFFLWSADVISSVSHRERFPFVFVFSRDLSCVCVLYIFSFRLLDDRYIFLISPLPLMLLPTAAAIPDFFFSFNFRIRTNVSCPLNRRRNQSRCTTEEWLLLLFFFPRKTSSVYVTIREQKLYKCTGHICTIHIAYKVTL